jgi:segregation and condensation protein B
MNEHYLRNVIEAALLAAGRPVQPAELSQLFDENVRPTGEQLRAAIDALAAEYAQRGLELKETAGGVRIQVRRELAGEVSRLWPERPARYSRALLETLALIAYRQPITRGEIEGVRGVAVNPNIIRTLLERNWVRVVGQRDVPGRPELLGTTRDFLDYFGLKSLDELPPLAQLKAMGDINLKLDLPGEPDQAAKTEGEPAAGGSPAAEAAAGEAGESSAETYAPDDDEHEDGGELSAEGGESRELVAAPRENGD